MPTPDIDFEKIARHLASTLALVLSTDGDLGYEVDGVIYDLPDTDPPLTAAETSWLHHTATLLPLPLETDAWYELRAEVDGVVQTCLGQYDGDEWGSHMFVLDSGDVEGYAIKDIVRRLTDDEVAAHVAASDADEDAYMRRQVTDDMGPL